MDVQKKVKKDRAHQFAIYIHNLADCFQDKKVIKVRDTDIVHRMVRVVRFLTGDKVVLFDRQQYVCAEVTDFDKHQVLLYVLEQNNNIVLQPSITYLLPLLKKDSLQHAVYALTEVGVSKIQLVVTAKSRQSITAKELERLQKTVIAAAEQSKHYAMPVLLAPLQLLKIVQVIPEDYKKVVFDVQGSSFFQLRDRMKDSNLCLLVGPEGGFVTDELNHLQQYNFKFCILTSTILRAVQAVSLSAALFRLR